MEEDFDITGYEQLAQQEQAVNGISPMEQGLTDLYKQQQAYFSEDKRATNTTTLLTALALSDRNQPVSLQMTANAIESARQTLELGNERAIRHGLVADQMTRQLTALGSLAHEARFSPNPEIVQGVDAAYNNVLTWDYERKAKTAIEEAALERIQDLGMSDPIQARVLLDNLEFGNAEETIRQFNVKLSILRQRAEELDEKYQESGWGRFLINTVLGFIPTNWNFSQTGIVGTAGLGSLLAVGEAKKNESQELWNMPLDEFADYAARNGPLMESIRDNATSVFDLISDPGAAVGAMEDLITQGDSARTWNNIWGGVEIASAVPWWKLGSASRMLVTGGAAKDAVRNLDNAIHIMDTQGAEAMTRATGVTEKEITEELSVSAIKGGAKDGVPLSEPVAAHREAAQKAADELFNSPEFSRHFSTEEIQTWILGKIDEHRKIIGSPIKDVRMVPTRLVGGQTAYKMVFTVGKKDGFGYATEGAAIKGRKATGFFGRTFQEYTETTRPVKAKSTVTRVAVQDTTDEIGGKTYIYDVETPAGDKVRVDISVGEDGRGFTDVSGDAVNTLGPAEIRNIASEISRDIPELKVIEGLRTTGARAKAEFNAEAFGKPDDFTGGSIPEIDAVKLRNRTETIRDMSGQWFNEIEIDMPEAGWLTGKLEPEQHGFLGKMLGRWASSAARTTDPILHGMAVESGAYLNRAARTIDNQMMEVFRKLPKRSKDVVREIVNRGVIHERTFTPEEFDILVERGWGRKGTEAEHAAYKDKLLFDDIDWELRNTAMYLDGLQKGKSTIKFTTRYGAEFEEDAVVRMNLDQLEVPKQRVYDVSRNKHYVHGRNSLDTKTLKTMHNNGYVMVDLPEAIRLPEGVTVNRLLIKKTDIEISPLKQNQLAYTPGGHRMYTSRYFVKQGRKGVQQDTGTEFLLSPQTHRTAENIAEGNKWAEVMIKARIAVKENRGISAQELDDDIFLHDKRFPDGQEFLNGVTDGRFELEHPFETVFDREMPSMYNTSGEDVTRFFNEDELGINGYYRTTGRMYTSAKGEILRDTKGEVADVLDPFDTLSKSLQQVSRQVGLFNYKLNALERFQNTYKQFMHPDPAIVSPAQFVTEAKVAPHVPIEMRNQIEAQRNAIMNVLRFESQSERQSRMVYQSIAERLLGDGDSVARKWAHDAVWWWKDSNPLSAMRGLAFDAKLGMFNPGQLLVQASTMISATALSPKYGWYGMSGLFPMHAYILKRGSENVLDTMVKRGTWKSMGFDTADEFKEYARHAYKHGFMEMNGSHIMINNHGPNAHFGSFGEKQLRAREQARVFFYTSEIWNRLTAYRIAWGEAKDKGLRMTDPQFDATILRLADDYSMNMTNEASAWWQKGVLSIPTQFWAYNLRMMEAMFGKRFTAAQRARLIGVNMLIAGSAGVPGLQALSEFIKQKHGSAPDIESIWGAADRGVIDYFNYQMTGADVLIGERIGTGGWASDTVKAMFGNSEFGEKSFADLVGGATYSIGKSTSQTLWNLGKYAIMESNGTENGMEITKDQFINLMKEVSTFSNASKAMMVHQYGLWKSNKGNIIASGLPEQDAVYAALSFRPAKADEISYLTAWKKNKDEALQETVKKIRNYRQEAITTEQWEKYWTKANTLLQLVPVESRREVMQQVNRATDASFYDYVEQKVSEEQTEENIMEGLE